MDGLTHCFFNTPMSSKGLWLDDSPFNASVPLLLAQIATIVAISQALHSILRLFGQPIVVSQLLTGLILGPSGLSHFRIFKNILFSRRSWVQLNALAMVGLVLFRFIIGLKTDATMLKATKTKAVMIAIASRATPIIFITISKIILSSSIPRDIIDSDILTGISITWTLSSFIVITFLLNELNLLNSKIGRLAISASLLDNLVDILFHLLSSTLNDTEGGGAATWFGVILSFIALVMFMITVARPVALWIISRTPEGEQMDEKYFVAILVLALGCGLFSELIGYHAGVGMLLLGLALPSGPPLGYTLVERLEGVITTLSIPVLMAEPGFLSDLSTLGQDVRFWGYLQFFIILSVIGKFAGVLVCATYWCKLERFDAIPLALIMCTKGFYEVELILAWQSELMIDLRIATTFTLSIVFIVGITTPLIRAMYRPSTQYVDHNWRTIQHSKQNSRLHVLTCIHNQENVSPVMRLLESIQPTPTCPIDLIVLHLVQLAGRATTVLTPYYKNKNATTLSESDYIMNAFFQLAQQPNMENCLFLQPFVSISPHATMHDDICTLALDKKVSMVILPFRKASMIGSSQIVNVNVVSYAPCSVAILVIDEKNLSPLSRSFQNIAVYFLGGADDRESLALSMHMAENPKVTVTVFGFRAPQATGGGGEDCTRLDEEKLDDEILNKAKSNKRVVYKEEEVWDGKHLTTVIQSTTNYFDLLVVGRREGMESPLTSGLSAWSECPELGIIGDMLASTDFNCKASILVVQQQLKIGAVKSTSFPTGI